MTTKGRYRSDFAARPLPPRSPSPVGPRPVHVEHQDRRHVVEIDPEAFLCRRLVVELAGAVADMHEALELSWGTVGATIAGPGAARRRAFFDEARHRPVWIAARGRLAELRRRPDLSPPTRARLDAELAEVDRRLASLPFEDSDAEG